MPVWESALSQGASMNSVIAEIAVSPEAAGDIQGLYQQVLGRAADAVEVSAAERALAQGYTTLPGSQGALPGSVGATEDVAILYQIC